MNMQNHSFLHHNRIATGLLLLASALCLNITPLHADINIGGDVYGGGKNGAVGTGNLADGAEFPFNQYGMNLTLGANMSAAEMVKGDPEWVNLSAEAMSQMQAASNPARTSSVVVNDGNVRTVFGGGQNGRVFGLTLVEINGGKIGGDEWKGTVHGGVFAAGDGESALVFGLSTAWIRGGTIYNNVYGGGNRADLIGVSTAILDGGTIYGSVFGSARMADVYAHSAVAINTDDSNPNSLFVHSVYGGNDIAGKAGGSIAMTKIMTPGCNWMSWFTQFGPEAMKARKLLEDKPGFMADGAKYYYNGKETSITDNDAINRNNVWNSWVTTGRAYDKPVFIGSLYGGGNGAYDYVDGTVTLPCHFDKEDGTLDTTYKPEEGETNVTGGMMTFGSSENPLSTPNTERAYVQIEGGTIGYVYGGGNEATVTASADIYIDNPDDPCKIDKDFITKAGLHSSSYFWAKDKTEEGKTVIDTLKVEQKADAEYATLYQTIDRVFGGNNVAPMNIQPNWYLHSGRVNNLYGGGNRGNMTNEDGILVYVFQNADAATNGPNRMKINNLYGGCRMADVSPHEQYVTKDAMGLPVITGDGDPVTAIDAHSRFGHDFPADYAARVFVSGGTINNVYGGNDVSGKVLFGTDVEICGAVSGDVYGGGNGAYPYTDNADLAQANPEEWGDYYYDANGTLDLAAPATSATSSLEGLNKKRPHVEKTLVHIAGESQWVSPEQWEAKYGTDIGAVVMIDPDGTPDENGLKPAMTADQKAAGKKGPLLAKGENTDINRVYVLGGVYCGGNSATLQSEGTSTKPTATLKIGECVTIDKVFLGSNGEHMVDKDLLTMYHDGVTYGGTTYDLAQFDLTKDDNELTVNGKVFPNDFAAYMEGCAMDIMPNIDYDNHDNVNSDGTEVDVSVVETADMDPEGLNFSARIGSFFCGGNVGSVTVNGTIGETVDENGKLAGLRFPRELVIFDKVVAGCNNANVPWRENLNTFYLGGVTGAPGEKAKYETGTKEGQVIDDARDPGLKIKLYIPCRMEPRYINKHLDEAGFWYVDADEPEPWSAPTVISDMGIESDIVGTVQILDRGNIYGGCYASGYVNGSVQIDVKDELCATAQMRAYFGDDPFKGQKAGQDGTAAVVDNMRRYVLNHGWSAFGGGYGKETEIWGNVYMNMSRNAGYINAYGGSQLGFIGKMTRHTTTTNVEEYELDANGKVVVETEEVNGKIVAKKDANGNAIPVKHTVTKHPGDYVTRNEAFVTTTTTTTTTTTATDSVQYYIRYAFDEAHDTYFNLRHDIHRSPVSIFGLNALYGGGYQGIVTGNTHMYAGGGLHYDVFGGACNADIYGYAETFVGIDLEDNFTNQLQLRHCVYGGNDFGGQILGSGLHQVTVNGETKNIRSNTYVQYLGGTIERDLYGGSCGLYRYNRSYDWTSEDGDSYMEASVIKPAEVGKSYRLYPEGSWQSYPTLYMDLKPETDDPEGTLCYNTFVDIACQNDVATDMSKNLMGNIILGNIYGGGYGMFDEMGRVDARKAYVVLAGPANGKNRLADRVFGGGYFSYVKNSTLDAVSGRVRYIYGGTSGTTVDQKVAEKLKSERVAAAQKQTSTWGSEFNPDEYQVLAELDMAKLEHADYTSNSTLVNVYSTLAANDTVSIYGAGAYTGSEWTDVYLYGGTVGDVYGGSDQEGVCSIAHVHVPEGSTVSARTIFGGSHGSFKPLPCDVREAYVDFDSDDAIVRSGYVYGGNNDCRASHYTYVHYNAKAKDANGRPLTIFGAGYGQNTVAGRTYVAVGETRDAEVMNVYGGGNKGSVFNKYDILEGDGHSATHYGRYQNHDANHVGLSYAHWYETGTTEEVPDPTDPSNTRTITQPVYQTNVQLFPKATVQGSVYGAGYGELSVVAGHTYVKCDGADVQLDIFGGGYAGNVRKMNRNDTGYRDEDYELCIQDDPSTPRFNDAETVSTNIDMLGGRVRNIFGGGYNGYVGDAHYPAKSTDTSSNQYTDPLRFANVNYQISDDGLYVSNYDDYTATTNVNVGKRTFVDGGPAVVLADNTPITLDNGDPAIRLSVYGAGDRGAVYGSSNVNFYNGHVGYDYVKTGTDAGGSDVYGYKEYLTTAESTNPNLYLEDGNIYGGGFGADARVMNTFVTFYDGVVRNSLYGGGEIAAVGWGTVTKTDDGVSLQSIDKVGWTRVYMAGGLVQNDVFGGGRGYSFNNDGDKEYDTKYGTDGYVFGKTDCTVVSGQVGTDASRLEENGAHGNVFGGGNIGYVFSGYGQKLEGMKPDGTSYDGYYYMKGDIFSEMRVDMTDPDSEKLQWTAVGDDGKSWTWYRFDAAKTGQEPAVSRILTEDCRVKVKVYGRSKIDGLELPEYTLTIHKGQRVPSEVYSSLKASGDPKWMYVMPETLIATGEIEYTFPSTYNKGDYIPNEVLNTLTNEDSRWANIDQTGVTIKNAVFAGGNVSKGSDRIYAYSKTVFGNATASLVDVYCRDLITVAGEGYGGLYGDGNLTFVDGYRELNVTNYGTDFYSLGLNADESTYASMSERQKAFYTTQYKCKTAYDSYQVDDVVMEAVWKTFSSDDQTKWERIQSRRNEGRFLNTIQRADYCGLRGSRIILNGAQDRAQGAAEADYTNYSVNRLGELSLNRNFGVGSNAESTQDKDKVHGSYFGIYSVVKYLGSMSSDFDYYAGLTGQPSKRTYDASNPDYYGDIKDYIETNTENGYTNKSGTITKDDDHYSFFNWKAHHYNDKMRNNGSCINELALASGVFLELVREPQAGRSADVKDYGPIIGVVQLNLLNASPGEGGGYVYAENNHGRPSFSTATSYAAILSDDNQGLKTCRGYTYAPNDDVTDGADKLGYNGIVTSGNFVHPLKTIIDDCYPVANDLGQEAHYWYIKGDVYVYDQLISAYTGSAKEYQAQLNIPISINGKVNAKFRLVNILPGLYANPDGLYDSATNASDSIKVTFENVDKYYGANDPISYWDWYKAPDNVRNQFVLESYVCNLPVELAGEIKYKADQPLTVAQYNALTALSDKSGYLLDEDGARLKDDKNADITVDDILTCFSVVNEVSRDKGYLLTLDLTNPDAWNSYYTLKTGTRDNSITSKQYSELTSGQDDYLRSATFRLKEGKTGVYGQTDFSQEDVVSQSVFTMQTAEITNYINTMTNPPAQAEFEAAYVAKVDTKIGSTDIRKGTPISKQQYDEAVADGNGANFEDAYICVSTFALSDKEYRVLNQVIGATEYQKYVDDSKVDYENNFQKAYICSTAGKWGGKYFVAGNNYSGIDYVGVDAAERANFEFNKDALDLLYADYNPYKANSTDVLANLYNTGKSKNVNLTDHDPSSQNGLYSQDIELDFDAQLSDAANGFTYVNSDDTTVPLSAAGAKLTSEQFKNLPNDRKYYTAFTMTKDGNKVEEGGTTKYVAYLANETFETGGVMYAKGQAINHATWNGLSTAQSKFTRVELPEPGDAGTTYYYCHTPYTIGANDSHVQGFASTGLTTVAYTGYTGGSTISTGSKVPQGTVISAQTLEGTEDASGNVTGGLPNYQRFFTLTGKAPQEEVTLYVPVTSDIYALSKDRYVTAIYEYEYTEGDAKGVNYETSIERHVINIRLKFESDQPIIGPVDDPALVLPLEHVTVLNPYVIEGAFDIITGGWEIYTNENDAKRHKNGRKFDNGMEDAYWFQNGYWLAYYAETKMGRTYSEPVQMTVANYHRIMDLTAENKYLYLDHVDIDRNPKIYIGYDLDAEGKEVTNYAEQLAALKTFFDATDNGINQSLNAIEEYERKDGTNKAYVANCNNLEFFIKKDIDMTGKPWTPIGDNANDKCFQGNVHGDGHTLIGLGQSLFDSFCGNVYNLGVLGSFEGSGIADHGTGRAENCWVGTMASPVSNTYAVMGDDGATVINCYYPDLNAYQTRSGAYARALQDFYNGLVAYDLNRFYLESRYARHRSEAGGTNPYQNNSITRNPDGTIDKTEVTYNYEAGTTNSPADYYESFGHIIDPASSGMHYGYVESYYADGDFRYAQGLKPATDDPRKVSQGYRAIYPDDYIFFGQKLTYGLYDNRYDHNYHPVAASKTFTQKDGATIDNSKNGLLVTDNEYTNNSNRLYRAPAYYSSKVMGTIVFNRKAAFRHHFHVMDIDRKWWSDESKLSDDILAGDGYLIATIAVNSGTSISSGSTSTPDPTVQFENDPYYPHLDVNGNDLTAIDFTGSKQTTYTRVDFSTGMPYQPYIDFEGLDDYRTEGLTQNLLVYAFKPADVSGSFQTADQKTYAVLDAYLTEPTMTGDNAYGSVYVANASDVTNVKGHLVLNTGTIAAPVHKAARSHFLVDGQSFNCPIEYSYENPDGGEDYYMWYQRKPANYTTLGTSEVTAHNAWETLVLPFTATKVATNGKGEVTHFYGNDIKGHEYWLREFRGVKVGGVVDKATADFNRPEAGTRDNDVNNTFLWDTYYSEESGKDAHEDIYQQKYYKDATRTYKNYGFLTEGVPYIVSFPGKSYYEFDMSGQWTPSNTYAHEWKTLGAQTITYVSEPGEPLHVSDDLPGTTSSVAKWDATGKKPTDYYYRGTFLSKAYTTDGDKRRYTINADGTEFVQVVNPDYSTLPTKPTVPAMPTLAEPVEPVKPDDYDTNTEAKSAYDTAKAAYDTAKAAYDAAWNTFNAAVTAYNTALKAYNDARKPIDEKAAAAAYVPFRAYFNYVEPAKGVSTPPVRSILIGNSDVDEEEEPMEDILTRGLIIRGGKECVIIESHLDVPATVFITTAGGQLIQRVTIQPEDREVVPVNSRGIYLANRQKVAVM